MFHIHGFRMSFNTTKVLYVAEELGVEYKYTNLDGSKGEHKTPEHLKRSPLGKAPTLDHDGKTLFESGAICRYIANVSNSPLYPKDAYQRAVVDQWMDFYTCHLGRWLGTLVFERVFRAMFGMGKLNPENEKEALGFIEQQAAVVNAHLGQNKYLAGKDLSIADLFAFAYTETTEKSNYPLDNYPHLKKWYQNMKGLKSVGNVQKKV